MVKVRPFLKWAGSKYNCLERVLRALPTSTSSRLIEPFSGSAVIFMNTNYASHLLAESNLDLIQIYSNLKKNGSSFIDTCRHYFTPETNCKEYYYQARSQFNSLPNSEEKSALFLYLNRHGYNGLCRYNSKGIYNVPFGLYAKPYFPQQEMLHFHQKSITAEFLLSDFRITFELAEPGDVIYCDPPYVPITPTAQTFAYTEKKFSEEDQIELAGLAQQAASRGIPVIISNHDTEFTRHHYKKAALESFNVARWINCQTDLRQPVKELLAVFK
jgi:DNA adenine methylase